ncbi:MAG: hypothetical protein R3362_08775 [Rhodothermales bacterium]|nr:hypothetical protein [Rhodothermales bacterium]
MSGSAETASAAWGPLGLGLTLAACLFIAHVGVWRPVRGALVEHVAGPVAVAVASDRAAGIGVVPVPEGRFIQVERSGEPSYFWRMPANFEYLFAGLVLVAAFPRRRYWLDLWLVHVVLGVLAFGAFLVGVGGYDGGFAASEFVRIYAAPAASVAALALAFAPLLTADRGPGAGSTQHGGGPVREA